MQDQWVGQMASIQRELRAVAVPGFLCMTSVQFSVRTGVMISRVRNAGRA